MRAAAPACKAPKRAGFARACLSSTTLCGMHRLTTLSAQLLLLSAAGCTNADLDGPDAGGATRWGTVHVRVLDPDGAKPLACKLLLTAAGEPLPLVPGSMVGRWLSPQALASGNAIYGDPCDFSLELPARALHLTASQGIERELAEADVTPDPDQPKQLTLQLARRLDTTGYACADLHVHTAPSFDSDVPLDQRLISAVAEGLDAMAPTDHEVVGDWDAELARLHMADELTLVLGNEVTPDIWPTPQALGHFGLFPVPKTFDASLHQLSWQSPAALLERLSSLYPDSLIQANHPRWDASIGYFVAGVFDPRDPTLDARLGLSHLDAIELWNSHQFDALGVPSIETLLQDYYALLDLGFTPVATGNTDTHELSRHPLGYPRNCIRVRDDKHPGLTPDDVIEGLGLGRVLVTSGPWLEVSLAGRGPGETVDLGDAPPTLEILADAASWVPVNRVHIVVNGRTQTTMDVRSLPARLKVPLELSNAVSYIMVIADGDAPLPPVAGELGVPQRSFAFTNPLWVRSRR